MTTLVAFERCPGTQDKGWPLGLGWTLHLVRTIEWMIDFEGSFRASSDHIPVEFVGDYLK